MSQSAYFVPSKLNKRSAVISKAERKSIFDVKDDKPGPGNYTYAPH